MQNTEDCKESRKLKMNKDSNNSQVTKPKDMKFYSFSDKEFKITLLRKFNELQSEHRKIIQH